MAQDDSSSLWDQLMRGVCFLQEGFQHAEKGTSRSSWDRQSLIMGREAIADSAMRLGQSWRPSAKEWAAGRTRRQEMNLLELQISWTWKRTAGVKRCCTSFFNEVDVSEILTVPLRTHWCPRSTSVWTCTKSGGCSVRSGYDKLREEGDESTQAQPSSSYQTPSKLRNRRWKLHTSSKS